MIKKNHVINNRVKYRNQNINKILDKYKKKKSDFHFGEFHNLSKFYYMQCIRFSKVLLKSLLFAKNKIKIIYSAIQDVRNNGKDENLFIHGQNLKI